MSCKTRKSRFLTSVGPNIIYVRSNESNPSCTNSTNICGERGSQANPVLYDEVEDIINAMPDSSPVTIQFQGTGNFGSPNGSYTYYRPVTLNGVSPSCTMLHGLHSFQFLNNTIALKQTDSLLKVEGYSLTFADAVSFVSPGAASFYQVEMREPVSVNLVGNTGSLTFTDCTIASRSKGNPAFGVTAGTDANLSYTFNNCKLLGETAVIDVQAIDKATIIATLNNTFMKNYLPCENAAVCTISCEGSSTFKASTNGVISEYNLGEGGIAIKKRISDYATYSSVRFNSIKTISNSSEDAIGESWEASAGCTFDTIWSACVLQMTTGLYADFRVGGNITISNTQLVGNLSSTGGSLTVNGSTVQGSVSVKDGGALQISGSKGGIVGIDGGSTYRVDSSIFKAGFSSNNSSGNMTNSAFILPEDDTVPEATVTLDAGGHVWDNVRIDSASQYGIQLRGGAKVQLTAASIDMKAGSSVAYIGGGGDDSLSAGTLSLTGNVEYAIKGVGFIFSSNNNHLAGSPMIKGATSVVFVPTAFEEVD